MNLINKDPNVVYGDIVTLDNNGQGLQTGSFTRLQDGKGNNSSVLISRLAINFERGGLGGNGFQFDGVALTANVDSLNSLGGASPFFNSTSAVCLPSGDTSQRPGSPKDGDIRYNKETKKFEGYEDGSWKQFTTI